MATEGVFMKVPGSADLASSAFDFFVAALTRSSSVSSTISGFTPTSFLTGTIPIEIVLPATSGNYVDLARSYFHIRARMRKVDGTAITSNRDNDFPETCFYTAFLTQ